MDSLDAALRRAERCIASSREQDLPADFPVDQGLEPNADDLGVGIRQSNCHFDP